ncbi:MAG: transglutaminase family protein [Rhodocyclaceae bacterium]
MRYRIDHITEYQYDEAVTLSYQVAHLRPLDTPWQRCIDHVVEVTPSPDQQQDTADYFGNPTTRFELAKPHTVLRVRAHSLVNVSRAKASQPTSLPWEEAAAHFRQPILASQDERSACEFLFATPHTPTNALVRAFAAEVFTPQRPITDALTALTELIHEGFDFDPDATHVGTSLNEVLALRRGVCQDFTHLMIAAVRAMGLPARYVSGYLLTRPPPGQVRLVGADASHAWVSAFVPGCGWLEFDPTNNVQPENEHIVLAYGRDFSDVSPLRGVILGGGNHALDVAVTVEPAAG